MVKWTVKFLNNFVRSKQHLSLQNLCHNAALVTTTTNILI